MTDAVELASEAFDTSIARWAVASRLEGAIADKITDGKRYIRVNNSLTEVLIRGKDRS